MSNKTLIIIFSVLLAVLLGEIGYLFFYTPVIDVIKKNSSILICTPPQLVNNPLVSTPSLDAMNKFTRSLEKNNSEVVTYKTVTTGNIKNIQKIKLDNIEYLVFDLFNKNGEKIRNINIKEGDIIYSLIDGNKIPVTPDELQENQKIQVTLIFDVADFDKRAYREILVY